MTRTRRIALLAAALAAVLAAQPALAECRAGDAGGIGGTGQKPPAPKPRPPTDTGKDRGGVGGTGRRDGGPGGIGGTGRQAGEPGGVGGTGILGTITGFGSVCLNGLEVAYDDATAVTANGAAASAQALGVGQVVRVDAVDRGDGLRAERIAIFDAAVGPIEHFDRARGELVVLGQRASIDRATHVADAAALAPGRFVAVSGLRRADGSVAATRVAPAPKSDRVSVTGPIAGKDAIGGLAVQLPPGTETATAGRPALVVGRLDARTGALRAEHVEPVAVFAPEAARVSLEGFVDRPAAKGFRTEHADVDTSALGAAPPAAGERVIVTGPLERDGRVRAERVEVVTPERVDPSDLPHGAARDGDRHESETAAEHEREAVERPEMGEREVEVERPETPEVERPETPEVPEVERPETPEIPEVERPETPEIPEVERPETPEVHEIERPETPEVHVIERPEPPEVHEVERPEAPEIEKPEHDD